MKVTLTRQNKIDGKAGETVEVTPARAVFLLQYGLAVPAEIGERIETPEKIARAAAKPETRVTTRKMKK